MALFGATQYTEPAVRDDRVNTPLLPSRPPFAEMTVGDHRLALLEDGRQAFPAMLSAIAAARSAVCLETYIFRPDTTGMRFVEALCERARAGVEVNFLYDAWGSSVPTAVVEALHRAGARSWPPPRGASP